MTDSELIEAFEGCTIPAAQFHHTDHIRLAWSYLGRLPLLEAGARLTLSIRRFAEHVGQPGLYHATITWAYLFLIQERMRSGSATSWAAFAAANADLFRGPTGRYRATTVRSGWTPNRPDATLYYPIGCPRLRLTGASSTRSIAACPTAPSRRPRASITSGPAGAASGRLAPATATSTWPSRIPRSGIRRSRRRSQKKPTRARSWLA